MNLTLTGLILLFTLPVVIPTEKDQRSWDNPSNTNKIFDGQLIDSKLLTVKPQNLLVEITNNLYQLELLSEQAYRNLLIAIEQGKIIRKSGILTAVAEQTFETGELSFLTESVTDFIIDIQGLFTEAARSLLPEFLREFIADFEAEHEVQIEHDFPNKEIEALFFQELEATHNLSREEFEDIVFKSFQEFISSFLDENQIDGKGPVGIIGPSATEQTGASGPLREEGRLQQRLDELNSTGILDERVYNRLQTAIVAQQVYSAFELYEKATDFTLVLEKLQSPYVNNRLNALKRAGILSPQTQASILAALETNQVASEIQFLDFIERGTLVNLEDYSPDPNVYLPQMHKQIAEMLKKSDILPHRFSNFRVVDAVEGAASFEGGSFQPSINFTVDATVGDDVSDEALEALLDPRNCELSCELAISARFQNRSYQQAGLYELLVNETDDYYNYDSAIDGAINLFNKVLRDQESPYRLYSVDPWLNESAFTDVQTLEANNRKLGFIALTEEQKESFFNRANIAPDANTFRREQSGLNSDIIDSVINSLEATGALSHLSNEQIALTKARLDQVYIDHSSQILTAFDDIVFNFYRYATNYNLPNEGNKLYRELTLELARFSHGVFQPSNVATNYDAASQTRHVSFDLNGNRHSTSFMESDEGKHISDFVSFLSTVAHKESLNGRFYQLWESPHEIIPNYLFLTDTQYETLLSYGLFDLQPAN